MIGLAQVTTDPGVIYEETVAGRVGESSSAFDLRELRVLTHHGWIEGTTGLPRAGTVEIRRVKAGTAGATTYVKSSISGHLRSRPYYATLTPEATAAAYHRIWSQAILPYPTIDAARAFGQHRPVLYIIVGAG
jgi:hypothetical protein